MVGQEPALESKVENAAVATKRGNRLRLLIPVALVVLAVLILMRAAGTMAALPASFGKTEASPSAPGSQLTSTLIEEGRTAYAQQCATCHGTLGNRIPVAPLDSQQYVDSLGSRLEDVITRGRGTMPAWGKELGGPLDARQVRAVGEYIRSNQGLAKRADSATPAASPTVPKPTSAPAAAPVAAPPPIPHGTSPEVSNRCLDCHGRGASSPMPVNHAGRASSSCSLCHAQGPVTVALPGASPAGTARPAPAGTAGPRQ